MSGLRRCLGLALALALLVAPGLATWSIVVIDMRTGEVAVAGATCLVNPNLKRTLAVVRVGQGAACAQAVIDSGAVNRMLIWDGFIAGLTPQEILDVLALANNQHQTRQYGIVDRYNTPVTFTGMGADEAKLGVASIDGDLHYAIQGNVLTGDRVVYAAEQALLNTKGDLSQRVMAAMEAARSFGGDGRCSCGIGSETQCGSPPPQFRKSAHCAFLAVARIGDLDGVCNQTLGCANGTFLVDLKYSGGFLKPDPVIVLERLYADWRKQQVGRPDQMFSRIVPVATNLPADGVAQTTIEIQLADLEGGPVGPAPLTVTIAALGAGTPAATPGPIQDLGGGRYSIPISAGTTAGTDTWRVLVDDGIAPVALQPDPVIQIGP